MSADSRPRFGYLIVNLCFLGDKTDRDRGRGGYAPSPETAGRLQTFLLWNMPLQRFNASINVSTASTHLSTHLWINISMLTRRGWENGSGRRDGVWDG